MKTTVRSDARPAGTTSVMVWGIYLLLIGGVLLVVPEPLVTFLQLPFGGGFAERLLGMLTMVLGLYYVLAASQRNTAMYRWKIAGHALGVCSMGILMATGSAPVSLSGTALMDVLAGTWTWYALHRA